MVKDDSRVRRRIFRFAYPFARKPDRDLKIHQLRDPDAFIQLHEATSRLAVEEFGGLLINWEGQADPVVKHQPHRGDLIALVTRPPLNDDLKYDRRAIGRSGSVLENEIFEVVREYIPYCTRSETHLGAPCVALLPEGFKNRASIVYHQNRDASYKECASRRVAPELKTRTAVFLIQGKNVGKSGLDVIVAFGMGGRETLVWNYLLRTRFPELLRTSRFVFAEMDCAKWYAGEPSASGETVPFQPADLSFADDLPVKFLIQLGWEQERASTAHA